MSTTTMQERLRRQFSNCEVLAQRNRTGMKRWPLLERTGRMTDRDWDQLKGRCPATSGDWSTENGGHGPFTCDMCGQGVQVKPGPFYAERGDMVKHDATREQVESWLNA